MNVHGWAFVLLALSLSACGTPPPNAAGSASEGSTSEGGDSTEAASASSSSAPDPSGTSVAGSDSTTGQSEESGAMGSSFLDPTGECSGLPDGVLAHCTPVECSLFDQDCNRGEACRAWANDGGSTWNAARCTPLEDAPGQPGEPCEVVASPYSGVDSCDVGSMCWDVDDLEGVCASYCTGSLVEPTCAEEALRCLLFEDGNLPLCLSPCDPLATECGEQSTCAWAPNDAFACVSQSFVPCPDGFRHYAPGEGPAQCAADEPCCVPYCDTSQAETCPEGSSCQPFYIAPNPEHPNLGLCWSFG